MKLKPSDSITLENGEIIYPIPNFPDYFIDKQTNVYSTKPITNSSKISDKPKLLRKQIGHSRTTKYYCVSLSCACHSVSESLIDTLDNFYWATQK